MNREKFFRNLIIAVVLITVAAFAGQLRRNINNHRMRLKTSCAYQADMLRAHDAGSVERYNPHGEVLVRFRSDLTAAQIEALTARLNDRVEDRYEAVSGLTAITDLDGIAAQDVVAQYESMGDVVEYAEQVAVVYDDPPGDGSVAPERTVERASQPNDPMFNEQWTLANTGQRAGKEGGDISALKAWEVTKGSEKLVVAVLDSGVEYTHPDLQANMWTRPASLAAYTDKELGRIDDFHGFNADANNGDPMDDNGHGTHCAGIVGAVGDNGVGVAGVNWNVQIMPLKFMGKGGFGTTKNAIEAINYTIERKRAGVPVRIISASWGSTLYSRALEDAIRKAGEAGILFVAASGNSSQNTDRVKHYPASYNLPNVLSIAALNRKDELASFSNYGAETVHIAAPGAEIVSTWLGGDYFEASGTSMATPAVAGIAALALAANPKLTMEELRAKLIEATDPIDSLKGKTVSGGRINAARAVGAQ
jgi:subtilisin family serine protease